MQVRSTSYQEPPTDQFLVCQTQFICSGFSCFISLLGLHVPAQVQSVNLSDFPLAFNSLPQEFQISGHLYMCRSHERFPLFL
jgi:hypothetical protein